MTLPSVSLSIIPMRVGRHGYRPRESFDITDSDLVSIEMLTGFLSLTHSDEIAAYVTAWEQLYSIADLRGPDACLAEPDLPAGERVGSGVYLSAPRPARQLLYVTGGLTRQATQLQFRRSTNQSRIDR